MLRGHRRRPAEHAQGAPRHDFEAVFPEDAQHAVVCSRLHHPSNPGNRLYSVAPGGPLEPQHNRCPVTLDGQLPDLTIIL
jgi:hypothetical protein